MNGAQHGGGYGGYGYAPGPGSGSTGSGSAHGGQGPEAGEVQDYMINWNVGPLGIVLRPDLGADMPPVVTQVLPGESVASLAGVRGGDMLVSINGKRTAKLGYDKAMRMLYKQKLPIVLHFRMTPQQMQLQQQQQHYPPQYQQYPQQQRSSQQHRPHTPHQYQQGSSRSRSRSRNDSNNGTYLHHAQSPAGQRSARSGSNSGNGSANSGGGGNGQNGNATGRGGGGRTLSMVSNKNESREDKLRKQFTAVWEDGSLGLSFRAYAPRVNIPTVDFIGTRGSGKNMALVCVNDVLIAINGEKTKSMGVEKVLKMLHVLKRPVVLRFHKSSHRIESPEVAQAREEGRTRDRRSGSTRSRSRTRTTSNARLAALPEQEEANNGHPDDKDMKPSSRGYAAAPGTGDGEIQLRSTMQRAPSPPPPPASSPPPMEERPAPMTSHSNYHYNSRPQSGSFDNPMNAVEAPPASSPFASTMPTSGPPAPAPPASPTAHAMPMTQEFSSPPSLPAVARATREYPPVSISVEAPAPRRQLPIPIEHAREIVARSSGKPVEECEFGGVPLQDIHEGSVQARLLLTFAKACLAKQMKDHQEQQRREQEQQQIEQEQQQFEHHHQQQQQQFEQHQQQQLEQHRQQQYGQYQQQRYDQHQHEQFDQRYHQQQPYQYQQQYHQQMPMQQPYQQGPGNQSGYPAHSTWWETETRRRGMAGGAGYPPSNPHGVWAGMQANDGGDGGLSAAVVSTGGNPLAPGRPRFLSYSIHQTNGSRTVMSGSSQHRLALPAPPPMAPMATSLSYHQQNSMEEQHHMDMMDTQRMQVATSSSLQYQNPSSTMLATTVTTSTPSYGENMSMEKKLRTESDVSTAPEGLSLSQLRISGGAHATQDPNEGDWRHNHESNTYQDIDTRRAEEERETPRRITEMIALDLTEDAHDERYGHRSGSNSNMEDAVSAPSSLSKSVPRLSEGINGSLHSEPESEFFVTHAGQDIDVDIDDDDGDDEGIKPFDARDREQDSHYNGDDMEDDYDEDDEISPMEIRTHPDHPLIQDLCACSHDLERVMVGRPVGMILTKKYVIDEIQNILSALEMEMQFERHSHVGIGNGDMLEAPIQCCFQCGKSGELVDLALDGDRRELHCQECWEKFFFNETSTSPNASTPFPKAQVAVDTETQGQNRSSDNSHRSSQRETLVTQGSSTSSESELREYSLHDHDVSITSEHLPPWRQVHLGFDSDSESASEGGRDSSATTSSTITDRADEVWL